MEKWIITGISGSGRIEILEEVKAEAEKQGYTAMVHDVGSLMQEVSRQHKIPVVDDLILNMDLSQLRLLRVLALKNIQIEILKNPDIELHLIGVHATFRWKGRIIPGISYQDIISIDPDGFVNVINNLQEVHSANKQNPKWDENSLPNIETTQDWMMEEEFVTEVLAEVMDKPVFLVARHHTIANLLDLFFKSKKVIYLSYPITAIEKSEPELIDKINEEYLPRLQELFVVFNPLDVEDMNLTYEKNLDDIPDLIDQLTSLSRETIKARTIERDFQFIDQSDAVVVLYRTDKVSPGVLAEIYYAHRNQTPIYMTFPGPVSPFLEDAVGHILPDMDSLIKILTEYADS